MHEGEECQNGWKCYQMGFETWRLIPPQRIRVHKRLLAQRLPCATNDPRSRCTQLLYCAVQPHFSFRELKLILEYSLYIFKLAPSRGSLVLSVDSPGQHLPWKRTTSQMATRCWRSLAVRIAPQLRQQRPVLTERQVAALELCIKQSRSSQER